MTRRYLPLLATILATLTVSAPLALADCGHGHQAKLTCADGTQWDPATRSCVTVTG